MAVPFDSLEDGKLYLMTSGNEGYLVRVANKGEGQIGIIYRGIASGRAVVQRLDDGTLKVRTSDGLKTVQFEEVSQSGGRRRKTMRRKRIGRKRHSRRHI